jgi:hypothetical protein
MCWRWGWQGRKKFNRVDLKGGQVNILSNLGDLKNGYLLNSQGDIFSPNGDFKNK